MMYQRVVRGLVRAMGAVACLGVMTMVLATCLDVILRRMGHPLLGVVDIVQLAACVSGICALPYTTAVKGHVAVEFFFQKLPSRFKPWVDGGCRLTVALVFCVLSWRSWIYGVYMMEKGIGTMTLQIPMFWVMFLMSFSFAVTVLVKIEHVLHPGKEMMR